MNELAVCQRHYDRYEPIQTMCSRHGEHAQEKCEMPYCGAWATHVAYFRQIPGNQLRRRFGAPVSAHPVPPEGSDSIELAERSRKTEWERG